MPSDQCKHTNWTGAAFTIAGGYVWSDVYQEAFKRNLTIVGGGDPVSQKVPIDILQNTAYLTIPNRRWVASVDTSKVAATHPQAATTV